MDSRVILLQSIMLLYWESRLSDATNDSSELVKSLVEDIRLPDNILESDPTRDILIGLRSVALFMCSNRTGHPFDKEALIQRIRLNVKREPDLVEVLADGMTETDDVTVIKRKCLDYGKLLHTYKKEKLFKETLKKWLNEVVYSHNETPVNVKEYALKMTAELEHYTFDGRKGGPMGIDGVVGMIDMMDRQSVMELFETAVEETGTDGVLKTGYQAINRMLGWHGGFRRGDMIVVGAMEHNYKTGFTLNLTRQIATLNVPYMLDPKKKPMILHVSSENALTDNLMLMYQGLMENETGQPCSVSNIDREEATQYIMDRCSVTGYTLHMLRVNPTDFNYQSLFSLILQYEADGYEIHLLTLDYLNMLSKVGCTTGAQGMDTRDLFRRVRNFCSSRGITVITPHQISSDAKYLLRQGVEDFVKEIAGKAYWDSCKTIGQEVDMEILIHIEKVGEKSYLTVQRGKHRKSGPITPLKDHYCVLPFFDIGAVRDDVGNKDLSMRKIGSEASAGSNDAGGWFEVGN